MISAGMFFTVPGQKDQPASLTSAAATTTTKAAEPPNKRRHSTLDEREGSRRASDSHCKRSARACDRCRLKKAKCSGGSICGKCRRDGVVCVTTLVPRKDEYLQCPEYVHLVESQRNQLALALQKVLEARKPSDITKMETLLADMGVAIDSFNFTNPLLDNSERQPSRRTPSSVQTISPCWDDVFNDLHGPQLKAMESFSLATSPPMPELSHELSFGSLNPDGSPLADYNTSASDGSSSHLELTDFLQMCDSEVGAISWNDIFNGEMEIESAMQFR